MAVAIGSMLRAALRRGRCRGLASLAGDDLLRQRVRTPDGVDLAVTVGGDVRAPRTLVCIPGGLGTAETDFAPQLAGGLGVGLRVVAFDPRGYGGSQPPTRTFPVPPAAPHSFYEQDARDALAVADAVCGPSGRFSVLGWSDGANVACVLAGGAARARIDGLVVWGGNAYVSADDVQLWERMRDVRTAWSARMRETLGAVYGGDDGLQALNDRFTDAMAALHAAGGDVCLAALHRIGCPTLVVHGRLDPLVPRTHAEYIAAQVARARLAFVDEGRHNVHLRHALAFNHLVRRFLVLEAPAAPPAAAAAADPAMAAAAAAAPSADVAPEHGAAAVSAAEEEVDVDVHELAYGFMRSKALFAALHAGVFDAVAALEARAASADGTASAAARAPTFAQLESELVRAGGRVRGERLRTLLGACVATRTLVLRHASPPADGSGAPYEPRFGLSRSAREQLVRGAAHYWGDYLRLQVDEHFYARLGSLPRLLEEGGKDDAYEAWFEQSPEDAEQYTRAQHNGSLATARALLRRVHALRDARSLLDVGGGSGALAIELCRAHADARATVLDLPAVIDAAQRIVGEESADVRARIALRPGSATSPSWAAAGVELGGHDVVCCSYLCGSVAADALPALLARAFAACAPGGTVVVHDFMTANGGAASGPRHAPLWALAHVAVNPLGAALTPARVVGWLDAAGFRAPFVQPMIGDLTTLITARKPAVRPPAVAQPRQLSDDGAERKI